MTGDTEETATLPADPSERPPAPLEKEGATRPDVVAETQPSFSISSFRGPAAADPGERIRIETTVRNAGDEGGTVRIEYRIGGETLSSSRIQVDAEESRSLSFGVTVPDDLDPGTYQQGVFVAGSDIGQTSSLVVRGASPSFSVLSFRGPDTVTVGERASAEATVRNGGGADGTADVEYRIDGRLVATRSVSIDAGDSRTVTLQGAVPDVRPGEYRQTVSVRGSDSSLSSQITVEERIATFTVVSLDAPSRVAAGDRVSVDARVRNTGSVRGRETMEYRIDGRTVDTNRFTLDPGETEEVTFEGTVPELSAGVYTQGVFVEGASTGLTATLRVDAAVFAVSDLRAPREAAVGDTITVRATVRNTGARSGSTPVEYRIRDRVVARQSVDLARGERTTVSFEVTVPENTPAGVHRQGVFVDDTAIGQTTSLRVSTGTPRFEVGDVEAPSSAVAGQPISVTATVRNRGGAGGRTTAEYRIGDRVVASRTVQLNAGTGEEVTLSGVVPRLANGTYRQGVFLSPGFDASTSLEIRGQPPSDAAFRVRSFDAPSRGAVGDRVVVQATVRNVGSSRGTATLQYRVGERVVARQEVTLAAGAERRVTITTSVPDLAPGSYRHGVFVGTTTEGRTGSFLIAGGGPRFAVSDLQAPAGASPGETISVRATVTNTGEDAGETTLQYRFDGEERASRTVSLDPGESTTVTFETEVPDVETGPYSYGVFVGGTDQGQSSSLFVDAPTPTPTPTPTATPTPTPTPTPTEESGPGFTVGLAVLALLGLAVVAVRRRQVR